MPLTDDRGLYTIYLKTWGKVRSGATVSAELAAADWQEAAAMALAIFDAAGAPPPELRNKGEILQALADLLQVD